MGSTIQLKSAEGMGSKFFFDLILPTGETVHHAPSNVDYANKDLNGARILVVDDLEFNLITLDKIVGKWNAQLTFAVNGVEAVEKVKASDFDLILMDLQMPVMDGREATERIREFNAAVPIIALTASTNESTRREVLALGMNEFAGKPFEPDQLYRKIKAVLAARPE